jgi:V8-like Glu-specific endopeptidase
VSAELTGADRVQQVVYAEAGERYEIPLDVTTAPLAPTLIENLKASNIEVDGSYAEPSENFGPIANARLGSILAYAAWAARWPESWGFHRLRGLGVDPLPSLNWEQSALQILVGDISDPEASFARDCSVQVESTGATLVPGNVVILGDNRPETESLSLVSLPNFPAARQASAVLPPGQVRLHVEMPGFAAASFALTLLPHFVTVIVISREANGEVDVQQYYNPIDPLQPVHPQIPAPLPDDVRLVELGWRALQGRESLDSVEYDGLLYGKRSNPLLAIIAGYRMFGTEREDQFRRFPAPPPPSVITDSALWNMLTLFPGLPDVHVLAGMYDRERRDEHFQRAMDTGTPVLVEGFWTLVEWLTEKAIREQFSAPILRQSVLSGMVWTSFTETERAQRIEGLHVVTSTGHTRAADAPEKFLEVARSVGRLEAGIPGSQFLCTAFLVSPRLLLCPVHFAVQFAEPQADGSWIMRSEARVRFDLTDGASEHVVQGVVRTLRPPEYLDVDGGALPREALEQCWPVLLLLSEAAAAQPLVVSRDAPEAGQRVCVIGFPRSDARISNDMFAAHFAGSAGEKHVMPGAVLRSPGNTWTLEYDCFTADGTSGGPVVDLQTGAVIGIHVAASQVKDGRKRGIALAMTHFSEEQLSFSEDDQLRPPMRNEARAME